MHTYIVHAAYGWLTLTGILHFVIDVVSHALRGRHPPGIEATLYYGLHSAFALGQLAFGLFGLYLARQFMSLLGTAPALVLSMAAGLGWLAISFLFMEYRPPRFNAAVFCVLIVAAWATRPSMP